MNQKYLILFDSESLIVYLLIIKLLFFLKLNVLILIVKILSMKIICTQIFMNYLSIFSFVHYRCQQFDV